MSKRRFLNTNTENDEIPVYIEYPEGTVEYGYITEEEKRTCVARLGTTMYGTVDASLRWKKTYTSHIKDVMKMKQSRCDPCVLYLQKMNKRTNQLETVLIIAITVDDTLLAGRTSAVLWFKQKIAKKFKITDLGRLKKHLGIDYEWLKDENGDTMLAATMLPYESDMVKQMEEAIGKEVKIRETPARPGSVLAKNQGEMIEQTKFRSFAGKTTHWVKKLGHECGNANRELCSHMSNPGEEHWNAAIWFAGYLKFAECNALLFRKPKRLRVDAKMDSNFATNPDTRKSVSAVHITIDNAVTLVNSSTNQKTVSISTTNAEYIAAAKGYQEVLFCHQWIDEVLGEGVVEKPADCWTDNMGAKFLVKNDKISENTKHISIRAHFMRECDENKETDMKYLRTELMTPDVNNKNTPVKLLRFHRTAMRRTKLDVKEEVCE